MLSILQSLGIATATPPLTISAGGVAPPPTHLNRSSALFLLSTRPAHFARILTLTYQPPNITCGTHSSKFMNFSVILPNLRDWLSLIEADTGKTTAPGKARPDPEKALYCTVLYMYG